MDFQLAVITFIHVLIVYKLYDIEKVLKNIKAELQWGKVSGNASSRNQEGLPTDEAP